MWREIRRVPKNWEHPKEEDNQYKPMFQCSYKDEYRDRKSELKEWYKEYKLFKKWKLVSSSGEIVSEKYSSYTEYAGNPPSPPNPDDYMPAGTWYQLYETVSEWTPITPPFAKMDELIDRLANNSDFWWKQRTREGATYIVEQWYAMSGIMSWGKIYSPEEQYQIPRQDTSTN